MTHGCEWLTVGRQPVADSTAQKTGREKLLMTRKGHPPDVGPPPRPMRMGFDHLEGTKDAFDPPRVDQIAHLSSPECRSCAGPGEHTGTLSGCIPS